jgi:hypothetical protein
MSEIKDWQEKLGIHYGMEKEEALEKFREWRERMKTCRRCEGEKLVDYCEIHLICEEADNEQRNAEGDDNGSRIIEINESQALRTSLFETRKRASLR